MRISSARTFSKSFGGKIRETWTGVIIAKIKTKQLHAMSVLERKDLKKLCKNF